MKRILTIVTVLALAGIASAEMTKIGSAGAQFLKVGVGSKYQAMGEASVATVNDVYAMYWNPAGLAAIENGEVGFTNVNWVLDLNLNYVGFAKNFEDIGVFGVSATVLSMGDQEITTFDQQEGTGNSYTASSYAIGLSYARTLTARFSFGGTIKFLGERIHQEKSSGLAFDFGTMLHTGFKSLRLGMSISNLGPDLKFSGPDLSVRYKDPNGTDNGGLVPAELKSSPYNLPMLFRVGLAYDFEFGPKSKLDLAAELKHPNDNLEQGSIGAEFGYDEKFFLRGGYKFNYSEEGLTLGGGLRTTLTKDTKLVLDYAWQDLGRLQTAQRFSVGFTF